MAEKPKRREVVASVEEAAQLIQPGMTIMLGGFGTVNHSMAVLRQMIKNKVTNLTVIGAATGGLDSDMLIGAGCVRKVIAVDTWGTVISMAPYGGYKMSGYGREMGFAIMHEVTQQKSIWVSMR